MNPQSANEITTAGIRSFDTISVTAPLIHTLGYLIATGVIAIVIYEKVGLRILRRADAIVREETTAAGLDGEIWQFPVVLLADVRSVGVQGDGRTYGHPIVLRPVSSEDAMTADWTRVPYDVLQRISSRITNEVREVNRVVLDVTSKPPGTIEWE